MRVAPCPSCGAQVEFHAEVSVMAVCGFCRSTLVRHDVNLENLGKMAELAEDRSPFKLGFRGAYRKAGYALIGRLQLSYSQGYWNEWYARFDDGRLGWVSEGSGLCYVTFEKASNAKLPPFEAFKPGMTASLGGEKFTVSNIETSTCVAAEGELPFKALPGYAAPAVDLMSDSHFASLDYTDTPPSVYIGEAVALNDVLDPSAPNVPTKDQRVDARGFKCSSCGAPITVSSAEIRAVGCGHCGAVVDPQDANLAILSASKEILSRPRIPIGSQGKLRGRQYTLIGWLSKVTRIGGLSYFWDEYLLHSADAGYAWLTESDGHWNFAKPVTRLPSIVPAKQPVAKFLDRQYKHFQRCQAEVVQVVGEFTWQVRRGETATVNDYTAPPYLLSSEQTSNEITWTLGEYIGVDELSAAFKPATPLPVPVGVSANQPAPNFDSGRFTMAFMLFVGLALAIQMGFDLAASKQHVWDGTLTIEPGQTAATLSTQPFHIDGEHNLSIRQDANLDNRWLYADLALINQQTGEAINLGREVSYYSGVDSDGSWSEGSGRDDALIAAVPAGDYVLEVDAETEANGNTLTDRISLVSNVPTWMNFWLFTGLLAVLPIWAWSRNARFESRRWAESDYAPTGDDD